MITPTPTHLSLADLEREVRGATFQPSGKPWWMGAVRPLARVRWMPGVDAAVYAIDGALVAVARWPSADRAGGTAWAVATLREAEGLAAAC
jgi:hypothetical protein